MRGCYTRLCVRALLAVAEPPSKRLWRRRCQFFHCIVVSPQSEKINIFEQSNADLHIVGFLHFSHAAGRSFWGIFLSNKIVSSRLILAQQSSVLRSLFSRFICRKYGNQNVSEIREWCQGYFGIIIFLIMVWILKRTICSAVHLPTHSAV